MKKMKKGFTLIELVVVMAIIAVLALLIVAAIQAARRASIETQNRGNARTLETALEAYASRHSGQYPTALNGLTVTAASQNAALRNDGGRTYLTSDITGTCPNGGGTIAVPSTTTFTITISDFSCAPSTETIVH